MKLFLYILLWFLTLVVSLGALPLIFIVLSKFIHQVFILTGFSLLVFGLLLVLLGQLNTKLLLGATSPKVYIFTGLLMLILLILLQMSLFKKLPGPIMEKTLPEDTRYFQLETGSKLAYWYYEGQGHKKPYPMIFIHGGPGAHVRQIDRDFFKRFIEEGYDVYLYDQAGGGFSDTIALSEISMARMIKDLEGIRVEIDAEKIILIGQSFGANITAFYMSKHPEHLASAIFTAPGDLRPKSFLSLSREKKKMDETEILYASEHIQGFQPTIVEGVRFAMAIMTSRFGGKKAVENLISQKEMTDYATRMIPEAIHMAYHSKYLDHVPTIKSGGINVLINAAMHSDYQKIGQEVIHKLEELSHPVLVIRAEYDYVAWDATKYYDTIMNNSFLVYIRESGHIPWSINIEDTYRAMIYFLQEDYDKIKVYSGSDDPRGSR
jgi:proline iminopeptidase